MHGILCTYEKNICLMYFRNEIAIKHCLQYVVLEPLIHCL
jgi:hypothetical protein